MWSNGWHSLLSNWQKCAAPIRECKIIEKYLNAKSFLAFFHLLCITLHTLRMSQPHCSQVLCIVLAFSAVKVLGIRFNTKSIKGINSFYR